MDCELVHSVPGRVRIRLRDVEVFDRLAPGLASLLSDRLGAQSVRLSRYSRSLVLHYDGLNGSADAILGHLHALPVAELAAYQAENGNRPPGEATAGSAVPLGLSSAAVVLGAVDPVLAGALLLCAAVPIFVRALASVRQKGKLNVDVLDAAATAVLTVQGRLPTAAAMVWLVSLGDFIRDLTVQHSHRAIERLFDHTSRTAWVVRKNRKVRVNVEDVIEGDQVVVYPGELVPVDGTVLSGKALVDQKLLTGESIPVEKQAGDPVYAATVVSDGKLYFTAAKVGRETVVAKIVQFVRDAPIRETRMQNYAERFADRVVPWSFLGAGIAMLGAGNVNAAASLLIIDYGTGIRVAAPTTVLASIAQAAHHGILIKGGRCLEGLADVDAIIFDKTGTLTLGTPEIVAVVPCNGATPEQVLGLAAAAEQRLTHPVAKAVVHAAQARRIPIPEREDSQYVIGLGVEASIDGAIVRVGSQRFLGLRDIDGGTSRKLLLPTRGQAASPVFVARDGELIGILLYADPVRPEAAAVVRALRERRVREIVMVTGDHPAVAEHVARTLGIERCFAGALPEQKLDLVRALQRSGYTVAVVGDGINDSPALTQADVGIAVRGGTDVARVAAHVALLEGNLWMLVQALDIARESTHLIRQNWDLVFYPNTAAIALSLIGAIGPVGATLISNGSGLLASLNALRPLFDRERVTGMP